MKVLDFGLAKMVEEVRRAASVIGGTPYYMAPEQAVGDHVDHRADQYAFGVTLFQLVSGTVPFENGDMSFTTRTRLRRMFESAMPTCLRASPS